MEEGGMSWGVLLKKRLKLSREEKNFLSVATPQGCWNETMSGKNSGPFITRLTISKLQLSFTTNRLWNCSSEFI